MPTVIEAKKKYDDAVGAQAEFIKKNKNANGEYTFEGDGIKAFNERNDDLAKLHDEWTQLKTIAETESRLDAEIAQGRKPNRQLIGGAGPQDGEAEGSTKSLGQQFVESQAYKSNSQQTAVQYNVDLEGSIKAVFNTTSGYIPYPTQQPGAVPFAVRRPVVADLIPQTTTDAPGQSAIIYMEQTTQTFNAAGVLQGATKPESAFVWTRRTVPFEVIAHTLPITEQALEDVAGIRDIIDQQMTLGVQLAEETEILTGSGTSPDLQGFLTKTGIQTQAKGADDVFTATMKLFTKIRFTGFADVTGGVMHPNDWQDVVTLKDTTGRFIYGDPFAATVQARLWGVPLVITPAITENTDLFGDFMMYSRLWRRHGIRIAVGYVNDDFLKNQQTLRAEERVALQISRAAAFGTTTGI